MAFSFGCDDGDARSRPPQGPCDTPSKSSNRPCEAHVESHPCTPFNHANDIIVTDTTTGRLSLFLGFGRCLHRFENVLSRRIASDFDGRDGGTLVVLATPDHVPSSGNGKETDEHDRGVVDRGGQHRDSRCCHVSSRNSLDEVTHACRRGQLRR